MYMGLRLWFTVAVLLSSFQVSSSTKHTHTIAVALKNNDIKKPNSIWKKKEEMTKPNPSPLLSPYLITSLAAGVGSGIVASVVCAPLDLIRTRMQVMGSIHSPHLRPSLSIRRALQQIFIQDGIRGCFRGLGATLATVPAFWGIYFPMYEGMKGWIGREYEILHPSFVHMSSAIVSGGIADFVCNPMFVVRTRMQTEALHRLKAHSHPLSIRDTVVGLYKEGGIPIFWRGLTASLMGLSHVAIQFPVYEFLKAEARARNFGKEEHPVDLLVASALSKVCASLVTYPHEVIRSRMMDARGMDASLNLIQTVRHIVKTEGYTSLYTGLHVSLARVVPNCCITFVTYELFLRWARDSYENLNEFD